jgi:hypothetical protein
MADRIRLLCAGILLAGLCLPSLAQTADDADTDAAPPAAENFIAENDDSDESPEQQNYYIDRSEGEPRFIQRLMWRETAYILRYEVIVEKQEDDGSYRETERVSTEHNFAEFSLTAGRYRYRVDLYDLIDEFAFSTEWREFDIIRALQPELTRFSPQAFYLDEDDVWEITLHGKNLLPDSQIYLIQDESKIIPISRVSEGEASRLIFSWKSLVMGKYYIYVKNPGGLDTRSGPFVIANKKRFDVNLSLGYAPIVPLYGYLFRDSDVEAPFTGFFYPLGAAVKFNFFPFKRIWGNLGIEFFGSFTSLKRERQYYSAEALLLNTHLSILYQKYFQEKTYAVNVGLGLGATTLYDFHFTYPSGGQTEPISAIIPSIIQEFSFTVFVRKPFFINTGIDFIQTFSTDKPMPGFIRLFVMAGVHL